MLIDKNKSVGLNKQAKSDAKKVLNVGHCNDNEDDKMLDDFNLVQTNSKSYDEDIEGYGEPIEM